MAAALAPRSLLQSFNDPLPTYRYNGTVHKASEGGTESKNTTSPNFAVRRTQANRWSAVGQVFLNNLQNASTVPLWTAFLNERIYNKEQPIQHRNEADIVRTSALYLIHPVSQALNTHSMLNGTLSSQCEDNKTRGVRTDMTFLRAAQPEPRPFAVFEYKRRTIIASSRLNAAVRPYNPAAATAAADLAAILTSLTPPGVPRPISAFEGGSLHLIKQASAYAIKKSTRYVAMFDYDHLICFYFPELDHTVPPGAAVPPQVNNYVEIDVYPFAQSNQMRLALLGFLAEAYENTP
ncbi:hypothetical protein KVR01_002679 [Diaporthe batatas]|uniref:uncharacterized protein n=1 Tax=Diaporthe batatas TaxID=748121 RepID=UPI001D03AE18|nr:uncharacterized protein KVR01_002679 [Diaporthe batatas]KAG8166990.1 hypothetical protein KVR01_002679 [Diaporthe batatas]